MICASRGAVLYGPGWAWAPQNFLSPPESFQARRHYVHQNVVFCGMFDLKYTIHYKRHNHLHSLAKSVGTPLNINALIVPFID